MDYSMKSVTFFMSQDQYRDLANEAGEQGVSVVIRRALRDCGVVKAEDDGLKYRPRGQGKNFRRNQELKTGWKLER